MGYQRFIAKSEEGYLQNIAKCLSKVNDRNISTVEAQQIITKLTKDARINQKFAYTFNEYLETGVEINGSIIKLVDKNDYDKNTLQVSQQIIDKNEEKTNRYDVTIFMNGFPIADIELKNCSVGITQAVNQINRYNKESFNNLFKFIQLYIVSNETETRYAINNNTGINNNFLFTWSDRDNRGKISLNDFTDTFLAKSNIIDMVTKFIVRQHSNDSNVLKVLRPYQVFAIRSVIERVTNPMLRSHDGYIFHTTGSGKTITSWKCVQLLAEYPEVDKVIFLVDRRDLDEQTYTNFSSYDNSDIDKTDNTKKLSKDLYDTDKKYIITTIQKMNALLKKGEKEKIKEMYSDKRVVFIIDECHRSQSGDMHLNLRNTFTNSNYIGFTGTPIFTENQKGLRLTSAVFGDELHCYKINDAIRDKNVLDFDVAYYSTAKKKPTTTDKVYHGKVTADTAEAFHDDKRMKEIVKTIFEIHNNKTQNRRYTALFTVDSIEQLIKYYKLFGDENKNRKSDEQLKVSAIFTVGTKEEADGDVKKYNHEMKSSFIDIVKDFNNLCGAHIGNNDRDGLRKALAEALNSKPEKRNLDIVLVVKIFMTGFDSPMTNTLYVDRSLDYHELIQSFSRTNRVESDKKKHGNIVSFRTTKEQVDEAIKTFNDNKLGNVIAKSFSNSLEDFKNKAEQLLKLVGDNCYLKDRSKADQDKIIQAYKELMEAEKELKDYTEFNNCDISQYITSDQKNSIHEQIVAVVKDRDSESSQKVSILDGLDFEVNKEGEFIVDSDYINALIEKIDLKDKQEALNAIDKVRKHFGNSNNEQIKMASDMVNAFLDRLVRKIQQCKSNKELEKVNPIYEWKVFQHENTNIEAKTYIAPCEDKKVIENSIDSINDDKINNEIKYINVCLHSGAYLHQLYDRLFNDMGMIYAYKDKERRKNHILDNQLYGVTATDEEAIIARKKLYGDANIEGNIIVIDNLEEYFSSDNLMELADVIKKKTGVEKFDMVLGKPDGNEQNYKLLAYLLTGKQQNTKLDI